MLPSFLLLVFLTLSASSQAIQQPQSFIRIPNSPGIHSFDLQQDDKTVQNDPKISSETLKGTNQFTGDDEGSSPQTQRMLQGEPVLTAVQHTMITPPPGPPGPGNRPTVMTTEIYVANVKNEEEITIVVEDNLDPVEAIEAIENVQPLVTNGEDVFISSWWTFEDEETAFENWEQLESFLGDQYGNEPATGIDVNALEVPVEIEIEVPETTEAVETPPSDQGSQNINADLTVGVISLSDVLQNLSAIDWALYEQEEIEGVFVTYVTNLIVSKPKCKQVQTCQKVFVRPIGLRNVCKNQLVCPKV